MNVDKVLDEVIAAYNSGDRDRLEKAMQPVVRQPILAAELILELLAERKALAEAPAVAQVDAVFDAMGWPEPSGCGR